MSEQELKDCEEMLKDLLLNDNIKRKSAESKLITCLSSVQNKSKLVLYCSFILQKTLDLGVQMYCAIIIRKVFLQSEKNDNETLIKSISSQDKEILKNNLLTALNSITNKQVRKQIGDASATFLSSLMENEESWDDLLKYATNLLSSEITPENIVNIEFGLHRMTNIYSLATEDLKIELKIFLSIFPIYFKSTSLSLKSKTVLP